MLHRARFPRLVIAPIALLLTTCGHAPAEKFQSQASAAPASPPVDVAASNPPPAPKRVAEWTERLDAIRVYYANTEEEVPIRLYASDGSVDPDELQAFRRIVAAKDAGPAPMDSRLVQLVMKVAYHFKSHSVVVVSAYRPSKKRSAGKHATGEAIDFKLRGVDSKKLASYVRTLPKVGVGIYTHPDTQYMHLDVREESYHWLDASPPGKSWHEKKLNDPGREERDAAYTLESDLPEKP
ncbi:DUF882 domain-containing protein [Pendulispora rubella]|uniref:DUF882 domain-containing protein n=1 Tax=Pendulispora rubella TaxID=2741070 RepID=A0ABZ2LBY2_9BACT